MGDSLAASRQTPEAIETYSKALEVDKNCVPAMFGLAQILVAAPDAGPASRQQAIRLAARACELTEYRHFAAILILCDSHAAAGNLADAVSAASKALQVATRSGNQEQAELARSRLRQYSR